MLATLTALLSSSGLGAILGVAGSWLTKAEERKLLKEKNTHDQAMARLSMEELKLEGEQQLQIVQAEGEIAADVAAGEAFAESMKEQQMTYGIRFVDAIRGLMRPIITIYLLGVATWLTINVHTLVGGLEGMPQNDVMALYTEIIAAILFLTTPAVTWWFGSRPSSKRKD